MRIERLACLLSLSLVVACGDDDNPIFDAATGSDALVGVDAPATPDAAAIDAVIDDATVSDARVNDAFIPDAFTCSANCPAANASTMASSTNTGGIVIESINFDDNKIVLKNVTAGAKDITNWSLCFGPGAYQQIDNAAVIPDGGTLTLTLAAGCGGVTPPEVCVMTIFDIPPSEEFGLFESPTFSPPAAAAPHIRAYVRWGANDGAPSDRQEAANLAGLWPALVGADDFVPVCATHGAIIATGDVTDATEFASVNSSCF